MLYDTFDVTALLRQGDNAIGVWLAPGWFGDPATWTEMKMTASLHRFPYPAHALLAQLEVRDADGAAEIICSDDQWKTMPGPLTPVRSHWKYCFGFSGETYDGTRETPGWDTADFDDRQWARVNYVPTPTAELRARMIEPNRIRGIAEPIARERVGNASRDDLLALLFPPGSKFLSVFLSVIAISYRRGCRICAPGSTCRTGRAVP
jgi:alpha-L-rhamnosidase